MLKKARYTSFLPKGMFVKQPQKRPMAYIQGCLDVRNKNWNIAFEFSFKNDLSFFFYNTLRWSFRDSHVGEVVLTKVVCFFFFNWAPISKSTICCDTLQNINTVFQSFYQVNAYFWMINGHFFSSSQPHFSLHKMQHATNNSSASFMWQQLFQKWVESARAL